MLLGPIKQSSTNLLVGIVTDSRLRWSLRLLASRFAISVADNKWDRDLEELIAPTIESAPDFRGQEGLVVLQNLKRLRHIQRRRSALNGFQKQAETQGS